MTLKRIFMRSLLDGAVFVSSIWAMTMILPELWHVFLGLLGDEPSLWLMAPGGIALFTGVMIAWYKAWTWGLAAVERLVPDVRARTKS